MPVRLPILLIALVLVASSGSRSDAQFGGPDTARYSKVRQFFIPFSADPKRPISELRLFVQRNGADWEYAGSISLERGYRHTYRHPRHPLTGRPELRSVETSTTEVEADQRRQQQGGAE